MFLLSGSSASNSSISSATRNVSTNWTSPPIDLPDLVYSAFLVNVEALEFIGLDRNAAQRIFDNLKSAQIDDREDEEEAKLPWFIRGHLPQLNTRFENLPTADAFTSVGLTADTIAAILSPTFRETLETQTPFYWAFDTLRMRFNYVLFVEEKIKKSAERASFAKQQKKNPKGEDIFGGKEAQLSQ